MQKKNIMDYKIVKVASDAFSITEKMRFIINKSGSLPDSLEINSNLDDDTDHFHQTIKAEYLKCKEELHNVLTNLIFHTRELLPRETDYVQSYLPALARQGKINPYDFGGILLIVSLIHDKVNYQCELESLQQPNEDPKRIFISHSSKDVAIINSFIDNILVLGCGINRNHVFCSSIEATGVKTGNDIREHLKSEIRNSDVIILMISTNFNKSPMCLNEMGAAWVLDKNVKPLLFPQNDYSDIGWLYEISKGMKLDSEEALDELRDSLIETFEISISCKTSEWTQRKHAFIAALNNSV